MYESRFLADVSKNEELREILLRLDSLALEQSCVVSGAAIQGVLNELYGKPKGYGLRDVDILYYAWHQTPEDDKRVAEKVQQAFEDLPYKIDVENTHNTHVWYQQEFGIPMQRYVSVNHSIKTFALTIQCVGVKLVRGQIRAFAPYGYGDIYGGILRQSYGCITPEESVNKKMEVYLERWPNMIATKTV